MYFPAKTALVVVGLILASPSRAEIGLDAESLASVQMNEAAFIDPRDETALSQAPADPAPVTSQASLEADPLGAQADQITASVAAEPGDAQVAAEIAALSPEFFLNPNEAELAALIAADLAAAGELTTGSVAAAAEPVAAITLDDPEAGFSFDASPALPIGTSSVTEESATP